MSAQQKFEARKTDGIAPKPNDGFHYTVIYNDAKKNPAGIDPIAERKEVGMEIVKETGAMTLMREPSNQFRARQKAESEKLLSLESAKVNDSDHRDGLVRDDIKLTNRPDSDD